MYVYKKFFFFLLEWKKSFDSTSQITYHIFFFISTYFYRNKYGPKVNDK